MAEKVKIKFVCDYEVDAPGGKSYREGQTVSMSRSSADHFINRYAAVEVKTAKKTTKKTADAE